MSDPADQILNQAPWQLDAACRSVVPDLFFSDEKGDRTAALAVCGRCPVTEECLAYALAIDADGVWGGKTQRQRRRGRRHHRKPAKEVTA